MGTFQYSYLWEREALQHFSAGHCSSEDQIQLSDSSQGSHLPKIFANSPGKGQGEGNAINLNAPAKLNYKETLKPPCNFENAEKLLQVVRKGVAFSSFSHP